MRLAWMLCIRLYSDQPNPTFVRILGRISCDNSGVVPRFFREPGARCVLVRVDIPASGRLSP